jgi:hypothetical protein
MSPIKMQKIESGIRLVVELIENINAHKVESIIKLLSDDCILEIEAPAPSGTTYRGKEQIEKYFKNILLERKNLHYKTKEIIGFGHRCITRYESTWEDNQGRENIINGTDIIKEKDNQLCEILSYCKR